MWLALHHPEWDRSCDVCERYRVDEPPDRRTGLPMLRPPGVPTPCRSCARVPAYARKAGLPRAELRKLAVELTPGQREALRFYRECRAVGQFPDDPLVRWYAAVIREVEDRTEREPLERLVAMLINAQGR